MTFARRALLALALLCAAGCQSITHAESRRIPDIVSVADGSPQRAALNARVYDAAIRTVTRRFYDRDFNGVDFAAEAAARRAEAIARPDEESFYRALNAVLDLLDDAHTTATRPTDFRDSRINRQAAGAPDFGIRATVATAAETGQSFVFVLRVRPDSPGAEAGVRPGWRIESFNDQPWLEGRSLGPDRPDVIRFVDLEGETQVRTLQWRRMPPEIGTAVRRPDGVLVLQFFKFDDQTADWLLARLAEARADPPRGVVVNVRGNGGGTVTSAERIIGAFFPEPVPFAHYNVGILEHGVRRTRTSRDAWLGPVAVVIGRSSESAAEVLAAAFRDHRRGVLVGEPTAGAVVVSADTLLPDGGELQIGVSAFRTASGAVLEKVGVTPDIAVIPSYDDLASGRDAAVEAAARAVLEAAPAP